MKDNQFFIDLRSDGEINYRGNKCDHHVFGYINNDPSVVFHDLNYEEKAMKTRPYFSISTIMITKNEENSLARCLKSVKGISDEIIVVDTGSTDDTKRIAAKFTDKIYDYKWEEADGLGNFAAARNYSLDKATGDWAFYIDADEELIYPEEVPKYIDSPYFDTVAIKQKQLMLNDDPQWDQNANRLFRTHGRHRFYGVIHEFPRLGPSDGYGPLCVIIPSAVLAHYGYVDPRINSTIKLKRNHELLLKDIKQTPDKLDNYSYLMRDMCYFFQNEHNTKYLKKGLEIFAKFPTELPTRYAKYKWIECFKHAQDLRAQAMIHLNANYVQVRENNDSNKVVLVENQLEYQKYLAIMDELNNIYNKVV